jgi:hypothetical protein
MQYHGHGSNLLLHKAVQRGGRFDHFARHKFAMPGMPAFVENAEQEGFNEGPQALFRGRSSIRAQVRGILLARALERMLEHFAIEPGLVTKMIIDGGHVRARLDADFPHRGARESPPGKNLGRRFQQRFARGRLRCRPGLGPLRHLETSISNRCLKVNGPFVPRSENGTALRDMSRIQARQAQANRLALLINLVSHEANRRRRLRPNIRT